MRIMTRGAALTFVLGFRLLIVGVGIAAGLALWNQRPGALALARVAVALSIMGLIVTSITRSIPDNRPPGTALPITVALIAYNAAWFMYLTRAARRFR